MKTKFLLFAGTLLYGAAASAAEPTPLPLRRVRLYETGVGYFERSGALGAGDQTTLPIPRGHIDDALKTLVVLGGELRVGGIEFASSTSRSMAKKLAGLAAIDPARDPDAEAETSIGYDEVLKSFKGALVRVTANGTEHAGRIVDVLDPEDSELETCVPEQEVKGAPEKKPPCTIRKQATLVLLGERGEVRRFALADLTAVRATEPETLVRLNAALDALSPHGAQSRGALKVQASGSKDVTLGYVAEAPVWRSTYRLVMDDKSNQAQIQGWALLHNDSDEDWKKVQLELVNGRPDSFLFPLAAPRYAARTLVTPQDALATEPQLFDTTADDMWNEGTVRFGYGSGGLGLVGTAQGGGGVGHGDGVESGINPSDLLAIGNLAHLTEAKGVEAAALFRYTLPALVDLRAHSSALVPFVNASIGVRRIAWFDVDGSAARSGVHVTNGTSQTLPAGTIAFFADSGFAGESGLSRTKPGESRVIRYGIDLDVELTVAEPSVEKEPKLFSFDGERLLQHFVRKRKPVYTISNRSGSSRTVYVELGVVNNARVGGAELGRDAETGHNYAMFEVGPRQELTRKLDIEEGLEERFPFSELRSEKLRELAGVKALPGAQRRTLQSAASRLYLAEIRRGAMPRRQADLDMALADLPRLREHARILGGIRAPEAEAMAARIVALETSVIQLRRRLAELAAEAQEFERSAKSALAKLGSS